MTKLTTIFNKVQVGGPVDPNDTFTLRVTGQDGAFGFPEFSNAQRDLVWAPASFPCPGS